MSSDLSDFVSNFQTLFKRTRLIRLGPPHSGEGTRQGLHTGRQESWRPSQNFAYYLPKSSNNYSVLSPDLSPDVSLKSLRGGHASLPFRNVQIHLFQAPPTPSRASLPDSTIEILESIIFTLSKDLILHDIAISLPSTRFVKVFYSLLQINLLVVCRKQRAGLSRSFLGM